MWKLEKVNDKWRHNRSEGQREGDRIFREQFKGKRTSEYDVTDIKYDLNSWGFRCDEFENLDSADSINVFLGCSHTFGVGVQEEDTWAYNFWKEIKSQKPGKNIPYLNLAHGGRGFSFMVRALDSFISTFNIKKIDSIFVLIPSFRRLELPYGPNPKDFFDKIAYIPNYEPDKYSVPFRTTELVEIARSIAVDDDCSAYFAAQNYQHLKALAQMCNCGYINIGIMQNENEKRIVQRLITETDIAKYIFDYDALIDRKSFMDYGSDLAHFGKKSHLAFFNKHKSLAKRIS